MFRYLIIFFILNINNPVLSSTKNEIISNLKKINILSFNFIQTIGYKKENGNCIIKYPKKIYCEYNDSRKKIIVSNGKSLIIKYRSSGNYSSYPLRKTPLELLLDKDYLVSKISILEPKNVDNKYLRFEIFEKNNKINIFFDKKSSYLVGWQTEDIYQNLTITFLSSIKINQEIDEKIFLLPTKN